MVGFSSLQLDSAWWGHAPIEKGFSNLVCLKLSQRLSARQRFELHVFVCVHFSGNANVIMLASFVLHFAFRKCWVSTLRWPRFSLHLFDFSSQRKLVRDENGLLHFAFCICEITNFHLTLCDYVLEKRLTLWDGFVSFVPCGASVQHN